MRLQKKVKSYIIFVICADIITLLILQLRQNGNCKNTHDPVLSEINYDAELSVLAVPEVANGERKIAYYMWCENETFNFANYLSILSTIRFARPDKLVFQYLQQPKMDIFYYNTWFEELRQSVVIMTLDKTSLTTDICRTERTRTEFMLGTLAKMGGMYVARSTIFIKPLTDLNKNADHLLSSYQGYATGQAGVVEFENVIATCPISSGLSSSELERGNISCIFEADEIYPKDFWTRPDRYGAVVRTLMYGESKIPLPISRMDTLIPNIAHVMWVGGRPVDFLFYLCCLSLIYVVGVERLYVHGDVPPNGLYWDKIKDNDRVKFIPRELPNFIFNQRAFTVHMMADVLRSEIMIKYGGIYSDVDVIWTQPLNKTIRSYDAVASLHWSSSYWPYPNYINLGVSLGKRDAPFWREFRQSLRNLRNDIFGFNSFLQPYKIYERNPKLLRLYDHLQVTCLPENCFPLWATDFQKMDWRRETHVVHWNWPTPKEFSDLPMLLNSTTVWAQIGKHVLVKAGLL